MKYIKRQNKIYTFSFEKYIVTLEQLKNSVYGAPRYKAVIIPKENIYFNAVYTFYGSYAGAEQNAKDILQYYIDNDRIQ